ncbi:proteasome-associated protein ECM29 homolog [Leptidea sinapis]|uniref:proteasome-associated protein ECM29 homolog n=1 Tax=Leptidea sinapis TaxID=189913 RepID=UPI0021C4AA94|nr:proteasome-associated protein ECM29 homolog [Leptidea sinapis]
MLADSAARHSLDELRARAATHHYTTDTVLECMPFIDIEVMKEMLPKILELTKSPQLGTKIACTHLLVLAAHYLRSDLEPIAGKIMTTLLNGTFDRNPTVRKNYAEALGQVSAHAKPQSVEKLMRKLVNLYETKEDDSTRSSVALTLKAVAKAKIEHIKDNEGILAPLVYLAMHAPKDNESNAVEIYEEIWTDISPGRETGIRTHLAAIREEIEKALISNSWTKKIQAAEAIKSICSGLSSGVGAEREPLLRSLLAAVHGKTFDGKRHLVEAIAALCEVKDGEVVAPALLTECVDALVAEARKHEPAYKRHAVRALGAALAHSRCQRFRQVYDIVKPILAKNELSMEKDSDTEDRESGRERREQLRELKEAAYDLLASAWPEDADTQENYQEVYFEHCSQSYPCSSRSTQLAILSSMSRVLDRLVVLAGGPKDPEHVAAERAVRALTHHVAAVVDYTLKNSNQVRHRRDALQLMETLIKRLKNLNKGDELKKLHDIYQTYAQDLSKDSSYELRSKIDSIKVYFR